MAGRERWGNVAWGDMGASPSAGPNYAQPATSVGGVPVRQVDLRGPDVYHMPSWKTMSDPNRVKTLRNIVLEYGADPRVANVANAALARAGVPARDYKRQAAVLLKWVHDNVRYMNEPGERLQSPEYTMRMGYGDCDDLSILLASLYQSVRLPWRMVLSGVDKRTKQTVRWVEGTPFPRGIAWAHIYVMVGRPTFNPTRWSYAEPSLKGAKLGWDVVQARQRGEKIPVPELGHLGAADEVVDLTPGAGTVVPFFDQLKGIKTQLTTELHWTRLIATVTIGAVVSVGTTYLVEYMTKKMRKGKKKR
jgi:hypothetical protein